MARRAQLHQPEVDGHSLRDPVREDSPSQDRTRGGGRAHRGLSRHRFTDETSELLHHVPGLDLRHTFGTHMAAAGVPMRTLQEWMGHRDFKTTLIYADYAPSAHERELVERAFSQELGPHWAPASAEAERH